MTNEKSPPAPPPHVAVRPLLLRALVVPLALLAVVAAALAWQVGRLSDAASEAARAAQVIAQANEVQKEILDQETGLRGLLLTHHRAFLEPYEAARPEAAIDTLDQLTGADPAEAEVVARIRDAYHAWHAHAAHVLDAGPGGVGTAYMLDRKKQMDGVRRLVALLVGREEARRAELSRVAAEETRATTLGSVLVLLALGATLAVASRRAIRQVSGAYEDALARSERSEAALARLVRDEREARERTQEALRTKDEFLSTLSHELRTPLTAILGWSGVLRARSSPPETVSRALAAIERNAKAQAQIVDDLLDVSRIVSGKFQLRLAAVDLADVVHAAYDVVRFSAEAKGVVVALDVDPGPLRVVGDAARLQQIAWNLLSNAVKFTPRGGKVGVRLRRVASSLRLEVRDSGEGIPTEFLPHVFERFRQADASLKRVHGGLGLGLAIVKHLVDLHGGEVHAESEGPGQGALFVVTLPVGAVDLSAAAPPDPRPTVSLRGVRALLVDDDPDALALVSAILLSHGAEVECTTSGAGALAILKRGRVDVIVSDIGMPELDGYDLIEKVRSSTPAPPALALSAYAAADDIERARRAGFKQHLAKPVTPDHLVAAVASLVRASGPLSPAGTS